MVGRPLNGGTVQIDQDGNFVYRPMNAMAAVGGTDSFTVAVSDEDAGLHVHGLLGWLQFVPIVGNLLYAGGGHGLPRTITVTVDPVDGVDLSLPDGFRWGGWRIPDSRPRAARARPWTPGRTGTGGCTTRSTGCSAW